MSALHNIQNRTKRLPPLRVGVGGPVGSGKTTLVELLCKTMRERYDLVVITNDIYTKEDQRLLTVAGALEAERIMGVETGGCPHTAIREDASINLEALDRRLERFPNADIAFIESGGDKLAATFSPELSDLTIYVIDVAAGEKIPRKGGPGITKSDLFVINKTDLAPHVGADLEVMAADARRMRHGPAGVKPFVMTNLKTREGLQEVVGFIERRGMLGETGAGTHRRTRLLPTGAQTKQGFDHPSLACEHRQNARRGTPIATRRPFGLDIPVSCAACHGLATRRRSDR